MCVCDWDSKVVFNATDQRCFWPALLTSRSFCFTQHGNKREQIFKSVLWGLGGDLAEEQLGGLEHNYKVNDLNGVAMTPSWYPMSFLSKPLNYSSISSDFSVFCPSPKVLQTALYVVCWLRTSVLSPHFYFPYLLCSSVGKLLSHQPQKCPLAIIEDFQKMEPLS